jgi:hypothetical protein
MLAVELAMTRDEKTLIARDINPGRVAEPDGNTRNAPVNGRERLAEIQRLQPLQQRDELRKFITAYETRLRELTDDARRQQLNTLLQELAQATYEIVDELYQRTGDSRGPRSTTGVSAGSDPFMRDTRLTQRDLDHSDRSVPGRTVSSKATAAQQRKLAELAEQAEKDHPAFFRETITSALPWDRDRTAWSRVIRLPELRALAALPFTAAPPAAQEDAAIQVGVLVPRRVTLSPRGNPQTTILTVDTTPRTNP